MQPCQIGWHLGADHIVDWQKANHPRCGCELARAYITCLTVYLAPDCEALWSWALQRLQLAQWSRMQASFVCPKGKGKALEVQWALEHQQKVQIWRPRPGWHMFNEPKLCFMATMYIGKHASRSEVEHILEVWLARLQMLRQPGHSAMPSSHLYDA